MISILIEKKWINKNKWSAKTMRKLIVCSTLVVSLLSAATPTFAYTVKSGDTMTKIATDNGMALQDLSKANPQIQDLNSIFVGQQINLNGLNTGTEATINQKVDSNFKPFTATAYSMGTVTATGTKVAQGRTIAVDPNVIPLGSKVEIKSDIPGVSGIYTAEDTGSAVKGNKIDIYMNTYDQCVQFGLRDIQLRVLD